MEKYINGAIKEAIQKGKVLMTKIPGARELGPYFPALATTANQEIIDIIMRLEYLHTDTDFNDPANIKQKFSQFKLLSGKLSSIENVVIAAMSRKDSEDDEFMNKLVYEICGEINYPLQNPVTSCLSQKYYHIYPGYNLLCIPLLEAEFLLHIPDIYHELGHPLLQLDNPKVEPFQNNLGYFNIEISSYFNEEIKRRTLNKAASTDFDSITIWRDSWLENWSTELFCDLFATFTLGPAYLWSNLHMCTKMSWDVYRLPTFQKSSHPPGEARMRACLYALEKMGGFESVVGEIKEKWEQFKKIIIQVIPDDFSVAVPDQLLQRAVDFCLTGITQIKCELAIPKTEKKVQTLLNEAWREFWKDTENFHEWERSRIKEFRKSM